MSKLSATSSVKHDPFPKKTCINERCKGYRDNECMTWVAGSTDLNKWMCIHCTTRQKDD
jgi:hypothetical protein